MKFLALLKRLKPLDWLFFALSLGVTAASFSVYSAGNSAPVLAIESGGQTWLYPLDHDETFYVQGAEGITTIKIENGLVSFVDSPCKNKTCVTSHAISLPNQWIACLPNQVFAHIEGASHEAEFDIISN